MVEFEIDMKELEFDITDEDLETIAKLVREQIKRRMYEKGVTPESLRAIEENGVTLIDTGRLVRSIDYLIDNNLTMKVGTNIEYAEKHQQGIGTAKREFLVIEPATLKMIKEELAERAIKEKKDD